MYDNASSTFTFNTGFVVAVGNILSIIFFNFFYISIQLLIEMMSKVSNNSVLIV